MIHDGRWVVCPVNVYRQTGDVAGVHPEKQKPASDQEWRYQTELGVWEELKRQYEHNSELAHRQAEELRQQAQEKLDKVGVVRLHCPWLRRLWISFPPFFSLLDHC